MRRAYAPKFSAMEATEFEEEPPILIRKAPPRPRFPQPVLLHLPPSPVPSAAVVVAPGTPVQPGWISMAAPMGAMTSVAACGVQPFETAVCADGLGRVALKLRADLDEALKVAPTGFGADSAEVAPPLETTAELENPRCPETPALCGEEGRAPARLRAEVAECREATASALDLRCRPSVATWMKQPLAAVAAGCGTPAEDPCGAHKVRRVRFQAEGAPEGADMKYYGQDSLRAALSGGDVRLIRGDWLAQLHRKGGRRARVPRCQDLPADAFWRLEDEPWTAQIIAVSYCWATTEHPDPQGEQFFQYIGPLLDKYLAMYGQLALFWDWCSLPQEPRTEEETARFQRALDSAPLWYAHNATIIWMLTRPPDGVKDYSERGWPCFERAVCTLINCVARVLDLGALHGADWQSGSYADIEWKCRIKRRPPEPPPDFAGTLKGRRFAKKEDRHFVALKYEETFREIMGSVHNMDCKKLGWDDEDVCKLSQCLLVCMNLRKLKLRDNKIVDISALCEWLIGGGGSNLQTLDLSRNCIEDVTAMRAALTTGGSNIDYLSFWDNLIVDVTPLGEALAEDICLRELHLDKNKVFDVIPLGAALATNTTLQHLNLRSNCIQDIAALARGVAGNTGLQTLTLDDNQVTDVSVLGACLAQNQGLESLSLKTNHVIDVSPLSDCLASNSTLESLDVRVNPVVRGARELRTSWLRVGRCPYELLGCDGLEDIAVPRAPSDVRKCVYVDTLGYTNTWTLNGLVGKLGSSHGLTWCSDGDEAPPFAYVKFYPEGPDGINYISTEEWVSTLPREQIPSILAQLRSMADAALVEHNICDEMTVSTVAEDDDLHEIEDV